MTELIVGTHGRPGIVLTTDRDDLDLDTDTIVLAVSDTHVVGKESIITKRDVQLPPVARDALNTYCGHERTTPTTGNALFTSSDGRIDPSTLYRDIRDRSEEVLNPTTTSTEQPHASGSKDQSPKQLTPEQLWKYSFTTMEI